jgi:hypothetical protein
MPRLTQRAPAPPVGPVDVAALFDSHLSGQEELCAALEALADSLPGRLDTHSGVLLGCALHPALRRAHRDEEEVVFPLLLARHARLAGTLDRLRGEHLEDEDMAHELREAIAGLVRDRSRRDAELVGYMLRGFFRGLRRHLALEREHLLPLLAN